MQKASEKNNYLYNSDLRDRARKLRRKGTKAEACLWKFALKNRMQGCKFLRQRPVMNYIVDFMCPELMLIIETDGASHLIEGAKEKDLIRQRKLEQAGFIVLRFEDGAVLNNLTMVQTIIEQEVNKLSNRDNSPL
ncbi:endonuclease domain-containing protein [Bacteroidota bacterium]